jgi:hypothetical protein
MLQFEMHLDGEVIDVATLSAIELNRKGSQYLCSLKAELLKKHQELVSKSQTAPQFFLAGVPLKINSFIPLIRR